MTNKKKFSGQAIIEILVAMGVAALMLPAILTGFIASREGKVQQNKRLQAVALVREAIEATRSVRQADWNNIAENGVYHPVISGTSWSLAAGSETVDTDFTRQITIADYYRNGEIDPSTKKVEIKVSWNLITPSNITSTVYLTRLDNLTHIETTVEDFDAGVKNAVVVTDTAGGEVQLGSGGRANWCEPVLNITPLDLPKQGEALTVSAIEGRAFVGTGLNASGVSFANIDITNDYPPQSSILGTLDGYKTNDVFGEQNYAYIATDTNNSEVAIIDLTSLPYSQVGSFGTPGPVNAESVYVVGNIGYVVSGNKLYSFNLDSKNGDRPAVDADGVDLAGIGKNIYVVGTNVYVSVSASPQLQIVDASDPTNLQVIGSASVAGGDGVDVFVNETQTRAYLVTEGSDTGDEFFIIDTTDKNGNRPTISSYNTNGMDPRGVTVVPGNRAIIVGHSGEEYQVLNIDNENIPVHCGGLDIDAGINGVSSVIEADGDAYSYLVTGEADSEFKIIEGGPGGQAGTSGSFESAPFQLTNPAAFNRFITIVGQPNQTTISFQIGVADSVGGDCSGVVFSFVGPDGTADSFFDNGGPIPYNNDGVGYENPGDCFAYKAYFSSSDPASSPILYDITVNYSP